MRVEGNVDQQCDGGGRRIEDGVHLDGNSRVLVIGRGRGAEFRQRLLEEGGRIISASSFRIAKGILRHRCQVHPLRGLAVEVQH